MYSFTIYLPIIGACILLLQTYKKQDIYSYILYNLIGTYLIETYIPKYQFNLIIIISTPITDNTNLTLSSTDISVLSSNKVGTI